MNPISAYMGRELHYSTRLSRILKHIRAPEAPGLCGGIWPLKSLLASTAVKKSIPLYYMLVAAALKTPFFVRFDICCINTQTQDTNETLIWELCLFPFSLHASVSLCQRNKHTSTSLSINILVEKLKYRSWIKLCSITSTTDVFKVSNLKLMKVWHFNS